jgi:carboxyl-terminal processing protease
MRQTSVAALFFTLLFPFCVIAGEEQAPAAAAPAAAILTEMPQDDGEPVWSVGEKLAQLGEAALPELEALLEKGGSKEKLALSYALMKTGGQQQATRALENLIEDEKTPLARRLEAADVLGACGGNYAAARIGIMLGHEKPERVRVALAKSLWRLTNRGSAYSELRQIMNEGKSQTARAEAAIALARAGRFDEVQKQLQEIASRPGALADEARTLLLLKGAVERDADSDRFPSDLVMEVVSKIRRYYAPDETDDEEDKQLKPDYLASESARALLQSLDPFNDYLDEESLKDMEEQLRANYGGIGAWVGMRNGRFTILTPMYGKPAHNAGIHSMDVVEKIDGKEIKDMKLNDIIRLLKGEPKTPVKVTVWRAGWQKPKDIEVIRDIIDIPSVVWQELPGKIGYVRLNSFNDGDSRANVPGTADLLREALGKFKADGVRGVVLDLSNNPGGMLTSAVDVGKCFIGEGKTIVSSRGKPGVFPEQVFHADQGKPFYEGPLVVMINAGSASASEIVSGALRDHKRARLVGQKTFGKGSVQQIMPIWTTRGATRMKLTIAKYYLPNNECIHKKGIAPDVEVKESEMEPQEVEARWKIRENHEFDLWLEKQFPAHEKEFRELIAFDNYDPEKYPEFGSLMENLKKKYPDLQLTAEMVRKEIRYAFGWFIRSHLGEDFHVDLQESTVMQRSLIELGDMMPDGLPDIPVYKAMREKYEEEQKKLAVAEAARQEPGAAPNETVQP